MTMETEDEKRVSKATSNEKYTSLNSFYVTVENIFDCHKIYLFWVCI